MGAFMATATEPEAWQRVCLLYELRAAARFLQHGLGHLQAITTANDFYDLPMLLLATGFERLMKCVLCLAHLSSHGAFPDNSHLRRFGHDLVELLDATIAECYCEPYTRREAVASDLAYLRSDPRLREIVQWLSDFARAARYYRLDVVTGASIADQGSPENQWAAIENAISAELGLLECMVEQPSYDPFRDIVPVLVVVFERWARALARLLTLSGIAGTARSYATDRALTHFLFLRDDELGRTDYGGAA
jgi:hypothetical protein